MFKELTCFNMNGQDHRDLPAPPYPVDLSPRSETESLAKITSVFEAAITTMAVF